MTKPTISVDLNAAPPQSIEDLAAAVPPRYHAVVGLDVGDRQSHYCVLELNGGMVAEGQVKTTEASLRVLFEGKGRMRIALEAGAHSPWISRLLIPDHRRDPNRHRAVKHGSSTSANGSQVVRSDGPTLTRV